jgi:lactate dehydrogenase-like 2-hydroxyacid dehydrogenase
VGIVVLGHYPDYIELAERLRASCFNIPVEVWSKMSHEEQWEANRKFLDDAISRGDEILLATPLEKTSYRLLVRKRAALSSEQRLSSRCWRPQTGAGKLAGEAEYLKEKPCKP